MKTIVLTGSAIAAALALPAPTYAATIASEDFQAGASDWSDNTTEDPGANTGGFSRHLGRHAVGATVSKTFALSGLQSSVNIAFDFYRIDTWDNEIFRATATDTLGNSFVFNTGPNIFFDAPGDTDIYNFPQYNDRNSALSFVFNTIDTSFTLSFTSTLDQHYTDEAWGVDNLLITDGLAGGPGGIPEPSAWALMILGFGAVGAGLRTRQCAALARA
jgi:hypothetical protein